jgi:hypothetical protein
MPAPMGTVYVAFGEHFTALLVDTNIPAGLSFHSHT